MSWLLWVVLPWTFGMHVCFWIIVFSRYVPRSGVAGSYGSSVSSFWSNLVLVIKNLPAIAGDIRDTGLILGLGISPGGGHGNPLQYSCLQNPHGQRTLVGHSSLGHKQLDTTEKLSTHTSSNSYVEVLIHPVWLYLETGFYEEIKTKWNYKGEALTK